MQGVVVYARWDDVRPFGETEFDYVFGSASKPKNRIDKNAGLDLIASLLVGAPTQRQRLDRVALDASAVPTGPWREIVTTSGVDWK
jgi:hypothetical protein